MNINLDEITFVRMPIIPQRFWESYEVHYQNKLIAYVEVDNGWVICKPYVVSADMAAIYQICIAKDGMVYSFKNEHQRQKHLNFVKDAIVEYLGGSDTTNITKGTTVYWNELDGEKSRTIELVVERVNPHDDCTIYTGTSAAGEVMAFSSEAIEKFVWLTKPEADFQVLFTKEPSKVMHMTIEKLFKKCANCDK